MTTERTVHRAVPPHSKDRPTPRVGSTHALRKYHRALKKPQVVVKYSGVTTTSCGSHPRSAQRPAQVDDRVRTRTGCSTAAVTGVFRRVARGSRERREITRRWCAGHLPGPTGRCAPPRSRCGRGRGVARVTGGPVHGGPGEGVEFPTLAGGGRRRTPAPATPPRRSVPVTVRAFSRPGYGERCRLRLGRGRRTAQAGAAIAATRVPSHTPPSSTRPVPSAPW